MNWFKKNVNWFKNVELIINSNHNIYSVKYNRLKNYVYPVVVSYGSSTTSPWGITFAFDK
jgi:hypothetical protein